PRGPGQDRGGHQGGSDHQGGPSLLRRYKLNLRVYDVFDNLIHRYDPEVPNFNHRPFYCVTNGDDIYTLNKDLGNLAQKSEDDDYKISEGSKLPHSRQAEREVQPHRHRAHIRDVGDIERAERGGEQSRIHDP
ncbi:MAG: hypothetical protein ACKPKO_41925, partial [Candidatus Fonsibacter sp.]